MAHYPLITMAESSALTSVENCSGRKRHRVWGIGHPPIRLLQKQSLNNSRRSSKHMSASRVCRCAETVRARLNRHALSRRAYSSDEDFKDHEGRGSRFARIRRCIASRRQSQSNASSFTSRRLCRRIRWFAGRKETDAEKPSGPRRLKSALVAVDPEPQFSATLVSD